MISKSLVPILMQLLHRGHTRSGAKNAAAALLELFNILRKLFRSVDLVQLAVKPWDVATGREAHFTSKGSFPHMQLPMPSDRGSDSQLQCYDFHKSPTGVEIEA